MVLNNKLLLKYFLVLGLAILFYGFTCAPGALWQDSGMFHYRIWNNDIEGGLGLALSHPLYHLIGIGVKNISLGEFGYRVNLISAVCGAITVTNIFLLILLWLNCNFSAAIGAISLAVSWTFWQNACIAEVYTLYTALFTVELIFLLLYIKANHVKYLYLLAFFNGLAIANHMWAVIPLACYVVFLVIQFRQKQINVKNILLAVFIWMIGAAPYEFLIIRNFLQTGDFIATMRSAFFGNRWSDIVLSTSVTSKIILENIMFLGYNFPTPNILLFLVSMAGLYKVSDEKKYINMMLALLILFFLFAFRYKVPDRYAFFIPFYCLLSVFIGAGTYLFLKRFPKKVYIILILIFAFIPLPLYAVVPNIAENLNVNLGTNRAIPYRNEYTYFLRPWQMGNDGAQQFGLEALKTAEQESVIIADGTTVYALWY